MFAPSISGATGRQSVASEPQRAVGFRAFHPRRVISTLFSSWQHFCPAIRDQRSLKQICKVAEPLARPDASSGDDNVLLSYMSYDEEFYVQNESVHPILRERKRVQALKRLLDLQGSVAEKVVMLRSIDKVDAFIKHARNQAVTKVINSLPLEEQNLLLCLPAIAQPHVLQLVQPETESTIRTRLAKIVEMLKRVEVFYDSIGGIVGYQLKSLELIAAGMEELREGGATGSTAGATAAPTPPSEKRFLVAKPVDLAAEDGREVARAATLRGLQSMPSLAEIYPVGGAGDRLGLVDEVTGESLPAAMLPYCGRSMLENLIRDLQAREFLYFRLTGTQLTTPVAIMTSDAKGNNRRMVQLMESLRWFGRGRGSFQLFRQPMVPVMSVETGEWLLSDELRPMMKPGGHGAIWKLMRDEGVFDWMAKQGRQAALVRQISNPMAGMDTTLLALAGEGAARGASFGFMSCDRHVGAAEGVNVLQENKVWQDGRWQYQYNVTNIEYTEFDRLGITDEALEGAPGAKQLSVFPANTNVLYVGLQAAEAIVEEAVTSGSSERLMPGLIFNLKKKVAYKDPLSGGAERKVQAGRMECTMQNIADFMVDSFDAPMSPAEAASAQLSTFMVYNHRRKVTSSAKKRREPGSTRISQTPDGSFYDLQRNAWHLLQQCGVKHVPELGSVEQYLANGPGFIFLYHAALGPLWDVISQKIQGGALLQGSELVLEVAEARLQQVTIDGSLLVYAENVMGHMQGPLTVHGLQFGEEGVQLQARLPNELAMRHLSMQLQQPQESALPAAAGNVVNAADADERLVYSSRCGRISMSNVTVKNQGIDWTCPTNLYWKHQVARREAVRVVLQGQSEFEARDVVISGDHTFTVPDGYRMVVSQGAFGTIVTDLLPLEGGQASWEWVYGMGDDGAVSLEYKLNVDTARAIKAREAALSISSDWYTLAESFGMASPLLVEEEDSEYVLDYIIQDVASWIV